MSIPYTTQAKAKEIAKESIKESGVSKVSVSSTGTATDTVQYITIDGVEKKLAGGGSGENPYADILFKESGDTTLINTANEKCRIKYSYRCYYWSNNYFISIKRRNRRKSISFRFKFY